MSDRNLTEGPVWRALAKVSGPMSFGILAVLSVGVADAYFLGQLGSAPLAAVGFVYPVTTAITSLAIGLSAGANAVISQKIGAEASTETVNRVAFHTLGLGLTLGVAVALVFWLIAEPLFQIMGASDAAITEAMAYAPFWALSFPFLVGQMLLNAIFRAHGNGAASAASMILAAVFAIGLNPVLIFGWGPIDDMGTAGAAVATATGRVIALAVALLLAIRFGFLSLCTDPFKSLAHSMRETLSVGAPAAFSNAINPAGMAMVTAAVATLGEAAVAGFGAAARVQALIFVPMLALSAGIGPVVGQNWGAQAPDRARAAVGWAGGFCAVYGLLAAVSVTVFATPLAALFAEEGSDVAAFAETYLIVVSWSFAGYGMLVTANAAINGRSKALYSMGLSTCRIALVYVPLAWLGVWSLGYDGILAAAVAANVLAILGAIWCLQRVELWPGISRGAPSVQAT